MSQIWRVLIFVLCLHGPSWADEAAEFESWPDDLPAGNELFPSSFDRVRGVMRDFERPSKQTLALNLAPKFLELRASYWETRQENSFSHPVDQAARSKWGRYFDLLARSSPLNGKLVGETEIAYSTLGISGGTQETPLMSRFGVTGSWGKAGYGFTYRSFGRGFVPLAGAKVEHDRDENQIWGEYDFNLFRLRATAGEFCQKDALTNQLTSTRTAATSFHINKPNWSLLLSSSYSAIRQSHPGVRSFAFANDLAVMYRPLHMLTVEPGLQFKHEWEPTTGLKTDTPSAGFTLAFAPMRELQLVGRTSFTKSLREDPMHDASIVTSTAALNWKLDKSSLGDPSVSLHVEYKNDSGPSALNHNQAHLTGMIQFRLAGF